MRLELCLVVYALSAMVFLIQRKNALKCYARTLSDIQLCEFNKQMNKFTYVDYILAFIPVFNLLSAVLSIVQFTDMLDQIQKEFSHYCYVNYIHIHH